MIVKGKRYGTKVFVVPLRDPKTYNLLPGVNIGDIGKKMGRDGIDNGWIQFTNVRIPRGYMLQKHTKVSRGGEVVEPKLQQLVSYSSKLKILYNGGMPIFFLVTYNFPFLDLWCSSSRSCCHGC